MLAEDRAGGESCLLCGGERLEALFHKQGIPYHRCRACGFVFSRPTGNANLESSIEDFEAAYLAYLQESVDDARNFDALLDWIRRHRSLEGARVLDVGSGSGKWVRFLRQRHIDAVGIEPCAALYSRFLAGDPAFFAQTLEEFAAASPPGAFDAVIACDVIEHVERPDRFLASATRLLRPGGMLFVSTPDVASWLARASRRRWHYYNKYHLSYLSRATLAALARSEGLRERDFRRLTRRKSLGYLLQYLLDFGVGASVLRVPERLHALSIPVNLFDTMTVCFEKEGRS